MRTLTVDPEYCLVDLGTKTPPLSGAAWTGGLGGLIQLAAPQMESTGGAIILTERTARLLGLPDNPLTGEEPPEADGYRAPRGYGPWMEYRSLIEGKRPTINVAVIPWLGSEHAPTPNRDPLNLHLSLHHWATVMGTPWFLAPGPAGTNLLRSLVHAKDAKGKMIPATRTLHGPVGMADRSADAIMQGWENAEPPDGYALWTNRQRARRDLGRQFLHTYDIRRQWIAAANACVVAPFDLKHTGSDVDYTPRRAGLFLIDPRTWPHDAKLPDPCGRPGRAYGEEPIWVTSATLGLLHQLSHTPLHDRSGMVHDGYDIHDSYTADGTELLRPWGARMTVALDDPHLSPVAKDVYARTLSHIQGRGRPMYRPDWALTAIGLARANLWRKLWTIGDTTESWPCRIVKDAVTFSTPMEDPAEFAQRMRVDLRDARAGKFKWEKSSEFKDGKPVRKWRPDTRDAALVERRGH